jgi:hypothetical protein
MMQVATLPAFPHYQCLLETIWKQMYIIFQNLVSMVKTDPSFEINIETSLSELLPGILKAAHISLTCQNRLAMSAAGYFIDLLIAHFGSIKIQEYMEPDSWLDVQKSPFVEIR